MFGLHFEHDLALGYLAFDPVGIYPKPVIVGQGAANHPAGLYAFPDINPWLDGLPTLTAVGYGQGSTGWPNGDAGTWQGRDLGTAPLKDRSMFVGRPSDCAGNPQDPSLEPYLWTHAPGEQHSWVGPGDSGGPLLAGAGDVASGMDEPTPLPDLPNLPQGRYVIGVASTDGDYADGGETVQGSAYATTFDAGNGAWLLARINDIDGDGVVNSQDNCVAVPNPGQENCNRDAEREQNADELGDACDPVACPEFTAPVSSKVSILHANQGCFGLDTTREPLRRTNAIRICAGCGSAHETGARGARAGGGPAT